uniref:Uncharacterized protein n=1 Tax=virus sp. ctqEG8 TaxID=2827998 RepID=A0A8S5RFP3_9VIRU|nr:MAG TPA: hypothetical protein [virus sp. ctqEG8]
MSISKPPIQREGFRVHFTSCVSISYLRPDMRI